MTQNAKFIATAAGLLVLAWLFSGERLLDAVFSMPDLGPVDDAVIALTVAAEEIKSALGLPDLFGALRASLHALLGI